MIYIKKIVKKYFSAFVYFYKYLRYRLFVVVGLSILIGVLDGLGLSMFLPLIQMADGNTTVSDEGLGKLQFIIQGMQSLGITLNIGSVLLILFAFFALKGLVTYFAQIYRVLVNQFFISSLRLKLTHLFTQFSFKQFVTTDVGRIQNSFTGEIQRVTNAYIFYATCIQQMAMTLVYLMFVFMVDWRFAFLVCVGGLLTNGLYSSIYKKTKKQSVALTNSNHDYQGLIIQYVANFKYLKATGFMNKYVFKLKEAIKTIEANNKKIGILNAKIYASREPMMVGVVCLVILLQVFVLNGKVASVMISLLFFYRALTTLMAFQNNYNNYLTVSGSLDNISSFEKELQLGAEQQGDREMTSVNEVLKIQDVSFGFHQDVKILDSINLNIYKNQSIAFVGESGSGKTTLVNVISGLLIPNEGDVLIDNVSVREFKLDSFQNRIGYIAQEAVVFNDTIFANVTFWAEPNEINKKRFDKAVKQASIAHFIADLPEKENTMLGNNGINLSGGQKQRISIARELYKDIDILILDEATSALDSETEKEIQSNIHSLKGKYTIIIIAHRLSTIKNVDVIYLMDKGHITNQGNFTELCQKSAQFRKMVELQEI